MPTSKQPEELRLLLTWRRFAGRILPQSLHQCGPCHQEAEKQKEASEKPVPTGSERVLFIDDEETITDIARQMLERLGYEVVAMNSSIEALELFRAEPGSFDLVIRAYIIKPILRRALAETVREVLGAIPYRL